MKDKSTTKTNTIIYLLVLVVLFTMLIGTSYAYYVKKIKNGDETRVTIKTANMLMRYKEKNEINALNITPGYETSLDFSIENYSTDTEGKYKITLEIISPLIDSEDDSFVYELTGSSNKNSSSNIVVKVDEKSIPVKTTLLGKGTITPETLHNYKLTIRLKENGKDQNYLSGKTFIAKILVEKDYE